VRCFDVSMTETEDTCSFPLSANLCCQNSSAIVRAPLLPRTNEANFNWCASGVHVGRAPLASAVVAKKEPMRCDDKLVGFIGPIHRGHGMSSKVSCSLLR
jgi:hypothetical protein